MRNFLGSYIDKLDLDISSTHLSAIAELFVVIFITLIVSFIIGKILDVIHRKLIQTANPWDDVLVQCMRSPTKLAIWLIGFSIALSLYLKSYHDTIALIRNIGLTLVLSWFVLNFAKHAEFYFIGKLTESGRFQDRTTLGAVFKLLRVSIFITATLIVMSSIGIKLTGLIAFASVSGVSIGFAAKDLMANFFGTLIVYLDKPFAVGDWIRSPDRNIEGTVEDIGWRMTKIRTFDKRPLYVPNSVFTSVSIENPSRMSHRRIKESMGVRYNDMDSVSKIASDFKEMLSEHSEIDEKQTLIVNLIEFTDSHVNIMVYCFTHTTNWIKFQEVKQDVMLKLAKIVDNNNAQFAFPTRTLDIPEELHFATKPKVKV